MLFPFPSTCFGKIMSPFTHQTYQKKYYNCDHIQGWIGAWWWKAWWKGCFRLIGSFSSNTLPLTGNWWVAYHIWLSMQSSTTKLK